MKFNKYDQTNRQWRVGKNIGRVIRFTAIPKEDKKHVAYVAQFMNIHGVELRLAWIVPFGHTVHQLLHDLKNLASRPEKPWCLIELRQLAGLREPAIKSIAIIPNQEDAQNMEPRVAPDPGPVGGKLIH